MLLVTNENMGLCLFILVPNIKKKSCKLDVVKQAIFLSDIPQPALLLSGPKGTVYHPTRLQIEYLI